MCIGLIAADSSIIICGGAPREEPRTTSMHIYFHVDNGSLRGNARKSPLPVEVEASIVSINCSFREYIPWKLP